MFTNLYTGNTIEILSAYAQKRLEEFAQNMPNGEVWNLHQGGYKDFVDAIGLQADGTVVALYSRDTCSINPLILDTTDKKPWGGMKVALSTSSCGGVFYPDYNFTSHIDWEVSIRKYNDGLYTKNKIIVAVYEFDTEEEKRYHADIFIIPNSLRKLREFPSFMQNSYRNMLKTIFSEHHIHSENLDEELFVEVWATSKEELKSENLSAHGFNVTIDGKEFRARFPEYLPVSLFLFNHEGDETWLNIPVFAEKYYRESDTVETARPILKWILRLAQTDYRYRIFGNFEDCLQELRNTYEKRGV